MLEAENEEEEEYGIWQHPETGTSVHKARGGVWARFRASSRSTLRTLSSNRCYRAATTLGMSAKAGAEGGRSTLQVLAVGP